MKSKANKTSRTIIRAALVTLVIGLAAGYMWQPFGNSEAAVTIDPVATMYRRSAPNYDLNLSRNLPHVRVATGEQLSALNNFNQQGIVRSVSCRVQADRTRTVHRRSRPAIRACDNG